MTYIQQHRFIIKSQLVYKIFKINVISKSSYRRFTTYSKTFCITDWIWQLWYEKDNALQSIKTVFTLKCWPCYCCHIHSGWDFCSLVNQTIHNVEQPLTRHLLSEIEPCLFWKQNSVKSLSDVFSSIKTLRTYFMFTSSFNPNNGKCKWWLYSIIVSGTVLTFSVNWIKYWKTTLTRPLDP